MARRRTRRKAPSRRSKTFNVASALEAGLIANAVTNGFFNADLGTFIMSTDGGGASTTADGWHTCTHTAAQQHAGRPSAAAGATLWPPSVIEQCSAVSSAAFRLRHRCGGLTGRHYISPRSSLRVARKSCARHFSRQRVRFQTGALPLQPFTTPPLHLCEMAR